MPGPEPPRAPSPLNVSILSQAEYLIVSIHSALDDGQMSQLQDDLIEQVGRRRARGIVVDVAALDVIDSFAIRTLTQLAKMARLRGAETVVVGIAPEVAIAMVQFSLSMSHVHTALDLEAGLLRLREIVSAVPTPASSRLRDAR